MQDGVSPKFIELKAYDKKWWYFISFKPITYGSAALNYSPKDKEYLFLKTKGKLPISLCCFLFQEYSDRLIELYKEWNIEKWLKALRKNAKALFEKEWGLYFN